MAETLPDPDPVTFPDDPTKWVRVLPTGTAVVRIYPSSGAFPSHWDELRYWGPTRSRFDHHPGVGALHPTLGIMYGAIAGHRDAGEPYSALTTAIAEYYQDLRTVAPVKSADRVAIFRTAAPLHLLDLGDTDWVTNAGGNSAICSGSRDQARTWSRAIHATYPGVEGVVYASSVVPPGRAIALWERAAPAVPLDCELDTPLVRIAPQVENAAAAINYDVWTGPPLR